MDGGGTGETGQGRARATEPEPTEPTAPEPTAPEPTAPEPTAPEPRGPEPGGPEPAESLRSEPDELDPRPGAPEPTVSFRRGALPTETEQPAPEPTVSLQRGALPAATGQEAPEPTVSFRRESLPARSQQGVAEPTVSLQRGALPTATEQGAPEPTVSLRRDGLPTGTERGAHWAGAAAEWEPTVSLPPEPGRAAASPTEAPAGAGGAARSAVAAVLLNLTGLGLGYVYLRRWLRVAACLLIVALMVVVAFANDAASAPWLWRILAAAWVAGTAFDVWWVARYLPRPRALGARLRPVAVGLVAVLAVVAGHFGYAEAARATYAAGLDAQGRADCAAATRAFDAVTGPYELTLSEDVPAAAERRAECVDFGAAEQSEQAGAHADAVAGYRTFRGDHPGSVLDPFALEGARRVLLAWAGSLRSSGDLGGAIDRYHELLVELDGDPRTGQVREDLAATHVERSTAARPAIAAASGRARVDALRTAMDDLLLVGRELPGTAAAGTVPQGILDTFALANSAVAEGRFCDALPVLDYAVTLPAVAGVAAIAHGDRARSLSECGLANFHARDYDGATTRFETLVAEYPADPGVAQARSALITAEVGSSASVPMSLPAPIGAAGSESVVIYNAASTEVRVLVTGATAHELTLPACPGCPAAYEGGESCPGAAGKPSTTLQLHPGAYYVLQDRSSVPRNESVDQPITVQPGGGELCVTVTRD